MKFDLQNGIIHHKSITFEIFPPFLLYVINKCLHICVCWHDIHLRSDGSVDVMALVCLCDNIPVLLCLNSEHLLLVLCQHFELMCVLLIIIPSVKLTHRTHSAHFQLSMALRFSCIDLFVDTIQSLRLKSCNSFIFHQLYTPVFCSLLQTRRADDCACVCVNVLSDTSAYM